MPREMRITSIELEVHLEVHLEVLLGAQGILLECLSFGVNQAAIDSRMKALNQQRKSLRSISNASRPVAPVSPVAPIAFRRRNLGSDFFSILKHRTNLPQAILLDVTTSDDP